MNKLFSVILLITSTLSACQIRDIQTKHEPPIAIPYGLSLKMSDKELLQHLKAKMDKGDLVVDKSFPFYKLYTNSAILNIVSGDVDANYIQDLSDIRWQVLPKLHNDTLLSVTFISSESQKSLVAMELLRKNLMSQYQEPIKHDSTQTAWINSELRIELAKEGQVVYVKYIDQTRDKEREDLLSQKSGKVMMNEEGNSWDYRYGKLFKNKLLAKRLLQE